MAFELDELAIARLEAALRAQRDQWLPSAPPLAPAPGTSSPGIEETRHNIGGLSPQPSPSSPAERSPTPHLMGAHCDNACVVLSDELGITSLQVEDDPCIKAENAQLQKLPAFPRPPPLSRTLLGALLVSTAILFVLFANDFRMPASFPIARPASDSRNASINLEAVATSSMPQETSGAAQHNQMSSDVPTISQPETPATMPLASSGVRTVSADESARELNRDEIELLVQQGNRFIAVGDIAAARVVFERAAEAGSATAALAMGATYDPIVLAKLGAVGMGANVDNARSWYEKAILLGTPEAPHRLASGHATAQ